MSYMKEARSGAVGNTRLLKSYGGGSTGPRQHYASGGAVKGLNKDGPAMAEGVSAAGEAAKLNLGRPGRRMGGKLPMKKPSTKGSKGTHINVIVMGKGGPGDGAAAPAGPGPGAMPPMPPPDMSAGPPPGGPPMPPMRKHGGRVDKDDEKQDKAMTTRMVHEHEKHMHKGQGLTKLKKHGGRIARSVGGPAKPPRGFDAGAGGAKGRLEKIKEYGR